MKTLSTQNLYYTSIRSQKSSSSWPIYSKRIRTLGASCTGGQPSPLCWSGWTFVLFAIMQVRVTVKVQLNEMLPWSFWIWKNSVQTRVTQHQQICVRISCCMFEEKKRLITEIMRLSFHLVLYPGHRQDKISAKQNNFMPHQHKVVYALI